MWGQHTSVSTLYWWGQISRNSPAVYIHISTLSSNPVPVHYRCGSSKWTLGEGMGWSQIIYWICLGMNYELILMSLDTFLSQNKTNQQKCTQHRCWVDVLSDEFALLLLLGRASGEPHSYVLTRLSVTIYYPGQKIETGTQAKHRRVHARQITRLRHVRAVVSIFLARVVGIDRPTAVFDPAPGVKVGRCGQNVRVVTSTLCENNLLYMLLHIRLRIHHWSNFSEFSFAFDCQHWTTVQTILGLRKNAIKSKKPGLSFASGPGSIETCSFVVWFTCPSKKPIRRNNPLQLIVI